jgi:hypothetical protein
MKEKNKPEISCNMCSYPECKKDASFQLGVAHYNKKRPKQIIGFVCRDHMRSSIENVMSQCIGTTLWVVVCDEKGKVIYHSYEADQMGYKAAYGWELCYQELTQLK